MKLTEQQFEAMAARELKRADASRYRRSPEPFEFKPRLNVYVCDICKGFLVTIDRDPGATPFMMPCYKDKHEPPAADLSPRILARLSDSARKAAAVLVRMPDGRGVTARSVAYRVPAWFEEKHATVEFYRPTFAEYLAMADGPLADEVSRGNLLFREISKPDSGSKQIEETYK